MGSDTDDTWVEVAAVGNDEEAEIIAGLLRSENIPCEIEGAPSPWPENLGALGRTRVLVPPTRAAAAKALLASRTPLTEEDDTGE